MWANRLQRYPKQDCAGCGALKKAPLCQRCVQKRTSLAIEQFGREEEDKPKVELDPDL